MLLLAPFGLSAATITESYHTLLKRAKLTTLQKRRLQDILILMFKVKNKLTMNQIEDFFNTNEENTTDSLLVRYIT